MSAGLIASGALADESALLKDEKAKDSYSLGYQFGRNIADQGVEIDKEALISAVRDALEGREPAISLKDINASVKDLRYRVLRIQSERIRDRAAKNLEEAKSFLDANSKKDGVVTLPSGLQYKVIREGKGAGPKATDGVRIRYRGTLVNGTVFDNSMATGEEDVPVIPVAGGSRGWTEALQLMKPGAKWQLFIPPQLGYGEREFGKIPANSVLVYDLELLSVVDRADAKKAESAAAPGQAAAAAGTEQKNSE